MATRITHSRRDDSGTIVAVRTETGHVFNVPLSDKEAMVFSFDEYYTFVGGVRARVRFYVYEGKTYLTTSSDGYSPNNLDDLPPF